MKDVKLIKDYSSQQLWNILEANMIRSGMYKHIMDSPELMREIEEEEQSIYEEDRKLYDNDYAKFMFWSRQPIVKRLIKGSVLWTGRWVSDAKRISPYNEVKENFFKYGYGALPAYYHHATKHGAIFKWSETAEIEVSMALRGVGKTHFDHCIRQVNDIVNYSSFKWLLGHGIVDKEVQNVSRIKQMLCNEALAIVFPELFTDNLEMYRARGAVLNAKNINIIPIDLDTMGSIYDPNNVRGESTINIFSPEVDVTGGHWNGCKLDDWVNQKNSESASEQKKLIEIFNALDALEEYTIMPDGKPFGFPIVYTDTAWWRPSLTDYILDNKDCKAFVMPMTWDPDEHKPKYYHMYRIDPMVTEDFIRKKESKLKEWFLSQCYMIGRYRDTTVKLSENRYEFTFGYKDEADVPSGVKIIEYSKETLHSVSAIILSKDPSYSKSRKEMDDKQSKDVTIRMLYKNGVFYITGSVKELGNDTIESQAKSFKDLSVEYDPDFIIIDSRAIQTFVANVLFSYLNDHYGSQDIEYVHYGKAKESSNQNKAFVIQSVLSVLFKSGTILVHHSLYDVISQILRVDEGFDVLDTIVQGVSVDRFKLDAVAENKEMMFESRISMSENKLQVYGKRDIIFKTTNY